MTASLEQESCDEKPTILKSEMKAALKGLETNKLPGIAGVSVELCYVPSSQIRFRVTLIAF